MFNPSSLCCGSRRQGNSLEGAGETVRCQPSQGGFPRMLWCFVLVLVWFCALPVGSRVLYSPLLGNRKWPSSLSTPTSDSEVIQELVVGQNRGHIIALRITPSPGRGLAAVAVAGEPGVSALRLFSLPFQTLPSGLPLQPAPQQHPLAAKCHDQTSRRILQTVAVPTQRP